MQDLGDDTGSIFGRLLGRVGDMIARRLAYRPPGERKQRKAEKKQQREAKKQQREARKQWRQYKKNNPAEDSQDSPVKNDEAVSTPDAATPEPDTSLFAGIGAQSITTNNRGIDETLTSMTVEGKESYDFLTAFYAREGIKFYSQWDAIDEQGQIVLDTAQFNAAELAMQETVDAINNGDITREEVIEQVLEKTPEIEAIEQDRMLLTFATREDDAKASILTNALQREGVEDFTVTTPDFEGNVMVSVRAEDAPCLVQVSENYIKEGTIENERFKNLDDMKQRIEARKQATAIRKKETNSPASSKDNATRAAAARNRNRATTPPARTQTR